VVIVQGDEILILPSDLERLVTAIEASPDVPAWNAIARIERNEELRDPSIVKCVVSVSERILFCSRDFSWLADKVGADFGPIRVILGILGYRRDFLKRYGALARSALEVAETIDQSRVVEHDVPLQGVEFTKGYPEVNEPRDANAVEHVLSEDPMQQAMLQEILQS
jgi:3-deoxy-manno-octulosonate cytidylyltransferase (CMP-KDO synthetase)